MAKLTIEHPHALPPAEVKKRLDVLNEKLSTKYGIEAKWKSDTEATFKRTGATGTLLSQPGKVVVNLDLSFLLSPMKDQVEGRIKQELARVLA